MIDKRRTRSWTCQIRIRAAILAAATLLGVGCDSFAWPEAKDLGPTGPWTIEGLDPDSAKFVINPRVLVVWFSADAQPSDVRRVLAVAQGEVLEHTRMDATNTRFYRLLIPDFRADAARMRAVLDTVRTMRNVESVRFDSPVVPVLNTRSAPVRPDSG
jgi:hypothetical protein